MKENVNPQVSNVDENGNYIYIWDKIVEDLQFAYDNLPDTWTEAGRVNKWAAGAMLANPLHITEKMERLIIGLKLKRFWKM